MIDREELKSELERSLGFAILPLKRMGGAASVNFKAVRASDAFAFAVKCSPPKSARLFGRLVGCLDGLKGEKVPGRLFARECLRQFRGYDILCTSWCDGERRLPHQLTDDRFLRFLDDYRDFSKALQRMTDVGDARPYSVWRAESEAKCRGLPGLLLRRVWREMPVSECTHDPARLRVIHSDFHHGNFLFTGGTLDRILDLEGVRRGYPAEDIVRYVTCAADHLRLSAPWGRRAILRKFALAVRRLPYARDEWLVAVNGSFLKLVFMRTRKNGRLGLIPAFALRRRAAFYRRLRAIVIGNSQLTAAEGV